jgi:hypothetical protein
LYAVIFGFVAALKPSAATTDLVMELHVATRVDAAALTDGATVIASGPATTKAAARGVRRVRRRMGIPFN